MIEANTKVSDTVSRLDIELQKLREEMEAIEADRTIQYNNLLLVKQTALLSVSESGQRGGARLGSPVAPQCKYRQ